MKNQFYSNPFSILISCFLLLFICSCEEEEEKEDTGFEFNPNINYDSITDIDGNTYRTLVMDSKTWMAENLKVTKFNDGSAIPNVTDDEEWENLTTAGYCWYNNDEFRGNLYGALYNWYTVETGKICPSGWHVPAEEEWQSLEDYLIKNGYNFDGTTTENKLAKALASSSGWKKTYQKGATSNFDYPEYINKTGFTAVPGGHREEDGFFVYSSVEGEWWSSTKPEENKAILRFIFNTDYSFGHTKYGIKRGASIRCVKE